MTYQSHIDSLPLPDSIDSCCLFVLIHSQNNISFTLLPQTHSVTAILFPLLCCYSTDMCFHLSALRSTSARYLFRLYAPSIDESTSYLSCSQCERLLLVLWYMRVIKVVLAVDVSLLKRIRLTCTAWVQSLRTRNED